MSETNSGLKMLVGVLEDRRELLSETKRLVPLRKPWLYPVKADSW
jgi:hypothetical protein